MNLNHLAERIIGWSIILAITGISWVIIINLAIMLGNYIADPYNLGYIKHLIGL